MRAEDIMALLGDESENIVDACGGSITVSPSGASDGNGHPVSYVHTRAVARMHDALGAVQRLHVRDNEHVIPVCTHCYRPYPCATIRAITESVNPERRTASPAGGH